MGRAFLRGFVFWGGVLMKGVVARASITAALFVAGGLAGPVYHIDTSAETAPHRDATHHTALLKPREEAENQKRAFKLFVPAAEPAIVHEGLKISNLPEPAAFALIGSGLVLLGVIRRRKRNS